MPSLGGELGLDPEQAQLRVAAAGQRAPRVDRQRQVLQRVGAPEREHHVLAPLPPPGRGRKFSRSIPGGISSASRPSSRRRSRFQRRDRHVAELGPVGVDHRVAHGLVVGVVAGLDVLHEVHRDAVQHARAPHRRGGVPPGRDLDRVDAPRAPRSVRRRTRSCAPARAASNQSGCSPSVYSATSCPRSARRLRCSKMSRCPPPTPVPSVT